MARPQKEGLAYFSLDVDFFSDRKIKILKGRFGADGITYYLYLLCEIYKGHGYYLKVDEDFDYITSSELGMSHAKIGQMRKFLLERSLFDNKLFQSDTILTSTSIQRRFQLAVKSRASKNPVVVNPKFWLLSKEETQSFIKMHPILNNSEKNPRYSEKNPSYSENYDIKKSKENVVVVVTRAREEMIRCFEQNMAPTTIAVEREIGAYLEEKQVTPELMRAVIEYSALSGAKSWRYVQTVLDNCLREGITTPEQFRQNIRSESNGQRTRKKEEPCSSSIDFEALQQYVTYGGHYESEKKTM
ncbi:MAG: Lin1244/Lin1753 domain-containing protein [Negativibacillus sp.]